MTAGAGTQFVPGNEYNNRNRIFFFFFFFLKLNKIKLYYPRLFIAFFLIINRC
jgi:hypothetical protein